MKEESLRITPQFLNRNFWVDGDCMNQNFKPQEQKQTLGEIMNWDLDKLILKFFCNIWLEFYFNTEELASAR